MTWVHLGAGIVNILSFFACFAGCLVAFFAGFGGLFWVSLKLNEYLLVHPRVAKVLLGTLFVFCFLILAVVVGVRSEGRILSPLDMLNGKGLAP